MLAGFFFRLAWLNYSLPDAERITLHFSGRTPAQVSPERLNVTRVLNTAFPDEADIIGGISNMDPRAFNFNPQIHFWGHFHFYAISAVYALGMVTKVIPNSPSKDEYFDHPEKMRRLYQMGRLLSIVMGSLSIFLIFVLTRMLFGEPAGIIAAALLAFAPMHIFLSSLMAFDVPMVFWALLTVIALCQFVNHKQVTFAYLAFFLLGLTAGAKLYGGLLALVFVWVALQQEKNQRSIFLAKGFGISFLAFAITNPYYLLDFPSVWQQYTQGSIVAREVQTVSFAEMIVQFSKNFFWRMPNKVLQCFGVISGAICVGGFIVGLKVHRQWTIFFLCIVLPVLILDCFFRATVLRYFMLPTVMMLPLAAAGLWGLRFSIKRRLISLALLSMVLISGYLATTIYKPYSDHEAGRWLASQIKPGTPIGVYHRMYYSPPIDWDLYPVTSLVRAEPSTWATQAFIVWPNINEMSEKYRASFAQHQKVHLLQFSPSNRLIDLLLSPYANRMGEYHHIQPQYGLWVRQPKEGAAFN